MKNKLTDYMKTEVLKYTDEEGAEYYIEHFETILQVSEIDSSEQYKAGCEPCEKYGKNLACPPYSPILSEYIKNCKKAKIVDCKVKDVSFTNGEYLAQNCAFNNDYTCMMNDGCNFKNCNYKKKKCSCSKCKPKYQPTCCSESCSKCCSKY